MVNLKLPAPTGSIQSSASAKLVHCAAGLEKLMPRDTVGDIGGHALIAALNMKEAGMTDYRQEVLEDVDEVLQAADEAWEREMAKARPDRNGYRQTTYPIAAKRALQAYDQVMGRG